MQTQEAKKRTQIIQKILKTHIKHGSTVLLATSGGPDSQFLLQHLIIHQSISKFNIICAHLNHQIRIEGENDANFINAYIKSLKLNTIEFISESKNINQIAKNEKISQEEAGRNERYKFFGKLCLKKNITHILTGHHADDNAETILFNLIRGASFKGLSGISEIQTIDPKFKTPAETKLLRPLLQITKQEILEDLSSWKTPYLIDKTNDTNDYTRNIIRNTIIPKIKTLNPSFSKTLIGNTKTIRETLNLLEIIAEKWIKENVYQDDELSKNNNTKKILTFNSLHFTEIHISIQKEVIKTIYKKLIGDFKEVSQENISEVILLINNNIGNKEKKLCNTVFKINHNIVTCKQNTKSQ